MALTEIKMSSIPIFERKIVRVKVGERPTLNHRLVRMNLSRHCLHPRSSELSYLK